MNYAHLRLLESINDNDAPLVTDNGNLIVDAGMGNPFIDDPRSIETQLLHLAGVVEVGLFIDMCDTVVLADKQALNSSTLDD